MKHVLLFTNVRRSQNNRVGQCFVEQMPGANNAPWQWPRWRLCGSRSVSCSHMGGVRSGQSAEKAGQCEGRRLRDYPIEGRRLPNRAEPIRVYLTKSSTHGRRATRGGRVYYFLESRDVNIQNIARCTTRACMRSKQLTIRQLSPIPHVCATIHTIHQYIIWSWDEARQHLLPRLRRPWGTSGLPQTNGRTCGGGLVGPLKKDWFWACTVLSGRGFRMKTTWRDWQSHQPMLSDIGASSTGKLKVFFWGMYCTYHFVIFQKWPHP